METAPPWVRRSRPCASNSSRSLRIVTTVTCSCLLSSSTDTSPACCRAVRILFIRRPCLSEPWASSDEEARLPAESSLNRPRLLKSTSAFFLLLDPIGGNVIPRLSKKLHSTPDPRPVDFAYLAELPSP